ncbi:MAG: DUF3035 domain-containing protein [Alphaproteobacteria bacterium]|nr:DUF3035 domain-containing protein [Alphaproteobacteria bacterium]
MRRHISTRARALLLASASAMLLSACGGTGLFNRERPDEFAVQRQTPLVVPPDFALTPPREGEPRPTGSTTQEETLDALFGGSAPRSPLERETVSRAGQAAPGIRSSVGDLATHSVAKGRVAREILLAPEADGEAARTAAGS